MLIRVGGQPMWMIIKFHIIILKSANMDKSIKRVNSNKATPCLLQEKHKNLQLHKNMQ